MKLEGKTKNKNVGCVGFKLINFYNKLLVWIEFKFVLNYCQIMQLEVGGNMGCVGFKFRNFW